MACYHTLGREYVYVVLQQEKDNGDTIECGYKNVFYDKQTYLS